MKYTICGFSQAEALKMSRIENRNGKDVRVSIDSTDLLILRWFVDFYPRMKKTIIEGREFAWLRHSELERDMPILGISARSCVARMKKLVSFGILDYRFLKHGGTWSYYSFGPAYRALVDTVPDQTTTGEQSNVDPVYNQTYTPVYNQTYNKDSSTIDPSSIDGAIQTGKRKRRHRYGEYANVLLTDEDLSRLKAEFPADWRQRIDRLSEYMECKGAKYKNHLATIRSWARNEGQGGRGAAQAQAAPKWEPVRHEDFEERRRREEQRLKEFKDLKRRGMVFG